MRVTPDKLNDLMEFDHVIRVHVDGSVSEPADVWAPDHVWQETDEDGQCVDDEMHGADGWSFLRGYTGQYGYSGPVMHDSEYVGGRLARDILETPRLYAVVAVHDSDADAFGWAVAYQKVWTDEI